MDMTGERMLRGRFEPESTLSQHRKDVSGCPTIQILARLEDETGRPVVSSNQAMLWYALKTVGVHAPVRGYGYVAPRNLYHTGGCDGTNCDRVG
jgi:hypothetical protein